MPIIMNNLGAPALSKQEKDSIKDLSTETDVTNVDTYAEMKAAFAGYPEGHTIIGDLNNKQNTLTIDSVPTEDSTNPVTSGGVYTAIGNAVATAITSVYKPKGSCTFNTLINLGVSNLRVGDVYNITDAFTTDDSFVEGSNKSFPAGTNVVCVSTTTPYWDVLEGFIDLSNYATKNDLNNKMSNPMEATGDIIVAGANGVPTRLGIGTAGKVLKSYGTTISWGDVQSSENSANIVDFTTKVIDRRDHDEYINEHPYKLQLSINEDSEPTSPNGTIFNIIKDLISNYIMFDDDDNFIPLHIDIPFAYPVAVINTNNNSNPIYVSTLVSLGIYAASLRTSMSTLYDAYVLEYSSNNHTLQYNQIAFSSNASASLYGRLENSNTRITTIYDDDYLANIPCLAGYAVICHGNSTAPHDVEYVTEKIELSANIINRIKNLYTLTIITSNPTITEAS